MSRRRTGSIITYILCMILGFFGIVGCLIIEQTGLSALGNIIFLTAIIPLMLLVAFGFRGLRHHRRLGDEVWWQLLIAILIAAAVVIFATFLLFLVVSFLGEGTV